MKIEVNRRLRLPYLLVALAFALVMGAMAVQVVLAQDEDDDEKINGCYDNDTGMLRVVDAPSECQEEQTPISWNKIGQQGSQDLAATQEEAGSQVEQGPRGKQGPRGPEGQPPLFARAESADEFSTDSFEYIAAPDGKTVTVKVPASGFIEVGASAFATDDSGAVQLFDLTTNSPVPGQSDTCDEVAGSPPDQGVLFSSPGQGFDGTFSTPAVPNFLGFCANTGGPSTVLLGPLSPGSHELELRYAACDCGGPGTATFSERRLWARPAP